MVIGNREDEIREYKKPPRCKKSFREWVSREYPRDGKEERDKLAETLWDLYKRTPSISWDKDMYADRWEKEAQRCPEKDIPGSYVNHALKITKKGMDTAFAERPNTRPQEPKMDIGEKIKVLEQIKVQLDSGFLAGPFVLKEGERLWIDSDEEGLLVTTYSPMFGIPKKDTDEIRLLFNQSKNDLKEGEVVRPSVNSMIMEKYAEMGSLQEWCDFYEAAHWVAGDDIRKGFYWVWQSDRRVALSATLVGGFHFICVVGIMGAADTPRYFDILMKAGLRIVGAKYPEVAYSTEGRKNWKAHLDDIRWVSRKEGWIGRREVATLQSKAQALLSHLGLVINEKKIDKPGKSSETIGWFFRVSEQDTIELTESKREEMILWLEECRRVKIWGRKRVERCLGKFNFCGAAVVGFNLAMAILGTWIAKMDKAGKEWIKFKGKRREEGARELEEEIAGLINLLREKPVIKMDMLRKTLPTLNEACGMDASSHALGGWQTLENGARKEAWAMLVSDLERLIEPRELALLKAQKHFSISHWEFLALVGNVLKYRELYRGHWVEVITDNAATAWWVNGRAKPAGKLWRRLHHILRGLQNQYAIILRADWQPSKVNTPADEISRLEPHEFQFPIWIGGEKVDITRHQELEVLIYVITRRGKNLGNTFTGLGKRSRWEEEDQGSNYQDQEKTPEEVCTATIKKRPIAKVQWSHGTHGPSL